MNKQVENFVELLSESKVTFGVENFYQGPENEIRRNNLQAYLEKMIHIEPTVLLLGEAPGYNGCRKTGIPFVSEYVLLNNDFFQVGENKFRCEGNQKEPSATIIWETLDKHPIKPLIWNTFPFHPYKNDKPNSNRKPKSKEIEEYKIFFEKLLEIFNTINSIIAVGKVAEKHMSNLPYETHYVRHPSRGGATEFSKGYKELYEQIYK